MRMAPKPVAVQSTIHGYHLISNVDVIAIMYNM